MPWDILDCIFSKVLFQLHLPTLPEDSASLSNAIKDAGLYFCPPPLFESNIILMTLMVIHSYLIRKNTNIRNPVLEHLHYFWTESAFCGFKKRQQFELTTYWQTHFCRGMGKRGRVNAAFLHWPQSANFTKGYIKSKHAMVALKFLLQYNNEVNSN